MAPGSWRPPRQMDSWFEEQLTAYPEDALTLAPLHLGEWQPPLQACGRCQHKDETTSRFRCPCHRERWQTAAQAAGGHWRIPDGNIVLVVSNLPGSRTCLGEQGRGTHDWALSHGDSMWPHRWWRCWSSSVGRKWCAGSCRTCEGTNVVARRSPYPHALFPLSSHSLPPSPCRVPLLPAPAGFVPRTVPRTGPVCACHTLSQSPDMNLAVPRSATHTR